MAYRDLREFMTLLEEKGLLARVKAEVDPSWEINGVTNKLVMEGGPAVLFESVKGHNVPLLAGVFGTLERLALALEMDSADDRAITEEWVRRIEHPISPKLVKSGPCKENILTGDKAAIDAVFPPVRWHKGDGGPYVGTMGVLVTRDPETGVQNAGVYRMMYRTRKETGLLLAYGQHSSQHLEKLRRLHPGKPMPVAVVIGTDPTYFLAAVSKFVHPPSEDAYAGALRREPLELVECETCYLEVPATAEIVFEGEIYPEERKPDGPFGEYLGRLGGELMVNVFHLKAITHRDNPVFVGMREGHPSEGIFTSRKSEECMAYAQLKKISGVADVHVPPHSRSLKLVISVRKSLPG